MTKLSKSQRQLLALLAIFLLPPSAAYVAWKYVGEHGVAATTNNGQFISPARPLQYDVLGEKAEPLKGRWTYVVLAPQGCEKQCQDQLYLTRQLRIAIKKDFERVRRVVFEPSGALSEALKAEHQDLLALGALPEAYQAAFQGDKFNHAGEQIFLIDPLGNLMMYYDSSVNFRGMLKDLQKLLKISQVG